MDSEHNMKTFVRVFVSGFQAETVTSMTIYKEG